MNTTFRKIIFWTHLVTGAIAGIIILVMSVTGVLLAYERQLLDWSERSALRAVPPAGASELPVSGLIEKVRAAKDRLPPQASLTLRADASAPAEVRFGREGGVWVNRFTGSATPMATTGMRAFFQKVTSWHRWLGLEGASRGTGKFVTGACNLGFLFLVVSGAYLWIPRRWGTNAVRSVSLFRSGLSGKARDFNWHNVFGLWALIPLFFVVLTAVPMSYQWGNNLVFRLAGSAPPQGPGGPPGAPPTRARHNGPPLDAAAIERLWTKAAGTATGWENISGPITAWEGETASFTLDFGSGGQPQKRTTLVLNASSGDVVRTERFENQDAGRRLRTWTRFVHTGEYYGIAGQTLAGLGSFAGVMLVWTGISLALRRYAAWRTRTRAAQA